jgi:hypothetical protein
MLEQQGYTINSLTILHLREEGATPIIVPYAKKEILSILADRLPYFGMSRTAYLQTLANRWGDFGVSWNWQDQDGNWQFTKKRSVLQLWHENVSRMDKVMHREAMPHEIFVEIDDPHPVSEMKLAKAKSMCNALHLPYAIFKSRKGYHMSVLDMGRKMLHDLIDFTQSDAQFHSRKVTWSLEWSAHWKQPDHIISMVECTPTYKRKLLGDVFLL